ncbi:SDR family NAD(P)-dependent oxidoreductase [Roseococcus sp. DSY-14]|uniref:SDR family NAD(P)-dependent oxidoreductase n=1 Tax=Roseococcus sp. DSY-14 TaxID=3369650 RepID=UPI00387B8B39
MKAMAGRLLILGGGYAGGAAAALARAVGWQVQVTTRCAPGPGEVPFDDPAPFRAATHLLATAPPGEAGDPAWARHAAALRAAPLEWVGYLSTTGVYGDRGGAAVDEATPPAPMQPRSVQRLAAERQWQTLPCAVDVMRVGGIYGPGRSAFDDLRDGTAKRVVKPGHAFGRIHRDDIARACLAAMEGPDGPRILHLVDDEPAEPRHVVEEAARLLGVDPPPELPFADAWARMSEMARSFWGESRRVLNRRTKAALGLEWRYPSYREGLRAILAEERGEGVAQQ